MDQQTSIKIVTFSPGSFLFFENEHSYHFYVIQKGQVEIFKTGPNGQKVLLATVGEGTSIGEFAMLDRQPRSATAQCLTEVQVALVSEDAYQKLIDDLPSWAFSVMKTLVERLRMANEIIRRSQSLDTSVRDELQSVEYDDCGTITNSNPFLTSTGDAEDESNAPGKKKY
jgi:CRP-like cAMP-binding protein